MFKKLEMFDHHFIDEYGNVLNQKTGNILKPYVGSGGYLYVSHVKIIKQHIYQFIEL